MLIRRKWIAVNGEESPPPPEVIPQVNTPTTLSRASFSGQKQSIINLQLTSMVSYAVGTAFQCGPILATITQLLPSNKVRAQVTGGPASYPLLLPKGAAVS